jgi:hypothetical protein
MSLVITYCLKAFRDFKIKFLSRPILIWAPHDFICPNPPPPRALQPALSDFFQPKRRPAPAIGGAEPFASDTGANPVMPIPHPSPDARRRRKRRRRLFRVTIGGTIPILVSSSAAPIRTTAIRRSVVAPLFENAVAIVQTALRRRSGSTADQQQSGG